MIYIGYVDLSLCTCAVSIFLSSCFMAYQLQGVAVLPDANFAVPQIPDENSISFRFFIRFCQFTSDLLSWQSGSGK